MSPTVIRGTLAGDCNPIRGLSSSIVVAIYYYIFISHEQPAAVLW
jgi:hypothetical protein